MANMTLHSLTQPEHIRLQAEADTVFSCALASLKQSGKLPEGALVVLGCSTSEVLGGAIGQFSAPEAGEILARAFRNACANLSFHPVYQCCEHLNRALVIESHLVRPLGLTQVNAIPQPKAGGSVPAAAWNQLNHPALVQSIAADAAIDVGDTLVGMHLRPVAVPLRIQYASLGKAHLTMAYSRLPYIGGSRAVYPDMEKHASID